MMNGIRDFGTLFWLPFILWTALFFLARFFAYPIFLKNRIKRGKNWCYVPERWSSASCRRKTISALFVSIYALTAFSSASTLFWLLPAPFYWFLFLFLAFVIVERPFADFAMAAVYKLELNAYYLEYGKQKELYDRTGRLFSEEDLAGHAAWAFRSAMRKAEGEGRFLKYLKEMSQRELAVEKETAPDDKT